MSAFTSPRFTNQVQSSKYSMPTKAYKSSFYKSAFYKSTFYKKKQQQQQKFGLERDSNLCDTGAVLYPLNHQANWELVIQ